MARPNNNYFNSNDYKTTALAQNIIVYNKQDIFILDINTLNVKQLTKENGILGGEYFDISLDKENNIWIGSSSGICKINHLQFQSFIADNLGIKGAEISAITKADKGNYYIAGNMGFTIVNEGLKPMYSKHLEVQSNKYRILDAVWSVENGYNYMSQFGYGSYNLNKNIFHIENFQNYSSILKIDKYIINSKKYELVYKNIYTQQSKIYKFPFGLIRKIFAKNDSVLVLCTMEGIYENKLFTNNVKPILEKQSAYAYCLIHNTEYLGTKSGLFIKKNNDVKFYQIPNYSISVYALAKDKYNRLWIGTNNGVFVLDVLKNKLLRINSFMNLNGLEVNRSAFLIDDDFILVGTNAGLNKIPIDFEMPQFVPPAFIQSATCNNLSFEFSKTEFLHFENNFSFTFCLNSYINEKENYFSYQLVGYDSGWSSFTKDFDVRYTNLNEGTYTFKVKAWNVFGQEAKPAYFTFTIEPPWWRTWWFYVLMFLSSVIIFYKLFKWRLLIIKRKVETQQLIAESELKALRAQINPHYLSNSMIGLQTMIMDKKYTLAIEAVSQYSKVMRNILNNSEVQFLPLDKEIKTLNEYMELEGLLNFETYEFKITCLNINEIKAQKILLPSMLIQPFIENSIIHGLKPKIEKLKTIKVEFSLLKEELLQCTIIDNGVGRQIKDQGNRKSMGNINVENRMKLYGKLLEMKTNIEIIDLVNNENNPIGTKVMLILPYKVAN